LISGLDNISNNANSDGVSLSFCLIRLGFFHAHKEIASAVMETPKAIHSTTNEYRKIK